MPALAQLGAHLFASVKFCVAHVHMHLLKLYRSEVQALVKVDDPCVTSLHPTAGGTVMSGVVGLFFRVVLGDKAWLARPLSVATSVAVLALTATPFPPGVYAHCDRST